MPYYKEGSKNDRVDAGKLADLLRTGMLRPVYHGENGLRTLRELGRSYQTISKDLNRVMNRLKAVYRGWSIACAGIRVYAPRYREEWLNKIPHAGVRRRAELLYEQLVWTAGLATNRTTRVVGGEPETYSSETVTPDSLHRSDTSRPFDRADTNPALVP